MRHFFLFALSCGFVASLWVTGCSKKTPQVEQAADGRAPAAPAPPTPYLSVPNAGAAPAGLSAREPAATISIPAVLPIAAEPSAQEKYDAALLDALNALADMKYADALKSLELARTFQDTDQVRLEISKIRALIDQQTAAAQTARDIQVVLKDGNPQDASRLATAGLQQFGSTDEAERLAQLKRQADALTAAQVNDNTARFMRFRQEGEAALAEKNLRAAAIAFDQALQCGEDAELRRKFDGINVALKQYDDNRARAAELRRNPANLEDAVAALQAAGQAWDTVQVREEIDLYTLALQKRRERISVADFEIRGDLGRPGAGRTIAEELLPAFKPRFDLVERSQLYNVLNELKLETGELADNESGRREVCRLAKVRYMVLGSVTPLCGITMNARLVDVSTGLVVQTAKIVAATPEELMRRLPQLAMLLGMTDEQKCAYEQQLASQATAIQPVVVAALAPAPEVTVVAQAAPPPIVVYSPCPPDPGGIRPEDFDLLPPVGQSSLSASLVLGRDDPFGGRLFQLSVELGDNLFRRGRYREAHSQFELALSLSPGHQELELRIGRCKPLLPPPPPVVVVAPPPAVVIATQSPPPVIVVAPPRPRVAVLNFVVNASPTAAPPGLGDWAADQMASYYAPTYDVVDRGQAFWYMGRLGLTTRDLTINASARISLARALNVRFFAFGMVQQTASLDVTTHLVDAETGCKQATGNIHVQDHTELKLRMNELVKQTVSDPAERARIQQQGKESERQINEARRLIKNGQCPQAIQVCRAALQQTPDNRAMQALLQQAEQQARQASLEEARKQEFERSQALAAAARKQQEELARQAETARQRAAQEAAARGAAAKQAQEQQRQQAYAQLLTQGQRALAQRDFQHAVQALQSAVALNPTDVASRALAQARAAAQDAARAQAAEESARRQVEQNRQRQLELERSKAQVEAERRRQEAEAQVRRTAQEAADQAAYAKLMGQGQREFVQGHYDTAIAAFQSALKLHSTQEAQQLLNQAVQRRQMALATVPQIPIKEAEFQSKSQAQARADLERRMAENKTQPTHVQPVRTPDGPERPQLPRPGISSNPKQPASPGQPQQPQSQPTQPPIRAQAQPDRFSTPQMKVPPTGQPQQPQSQPTQPPMRAQAQPDRFSAPQTKVSPQPPAPPQAKVPPPAQTVSRPNGVAMVPKPQPQQPAPATNVAVEYTREMQTGAVFYKQQKYGEAIRSYQEALRLKPGDTKATAALHMAQGRVALQAKHFTDAAREFQEALKLVPNQPEALQALKQAQQGRP
jgi:tetratricopeptide (TPR) repeat protein